MCSSAFLTRVKHALKDAYYVMHACLLHHKPWNLNSWTPIGTYTQEEEEEEEALQPQLWNQPRGIINNWATSQTCELHIIHKRVRTQWLFECVISCITNIGTLNIWWVAMEWVKTTILQLHWLSQLVRITIQSAMLASIMRMQYYTKQSRLCLLFWIKVNILFLNHHRTKQNRSPHIKLTNFSLNI